MASAAEAAIGAGAQPGRSVARHELDVIDASVLAPFPDVSRHVIDAELVRSLGRDLVRACGPTESHASEESPSDSPAEKLRRELPRAGPVRTVPGDLVGVITATEREAIGPSRSTARRVFPLRFRRQAESEVALGTGDRREDFA